MQLLISIAGILVLILCAWAFSENKKSHQLAHSRRSSVFTGGLCSVGIVYTYWAENARGHE